MRPWTAQQPPQQSSNSSQTNSPITKTGYHLFLLFYSCCSLQAHLHNSGECQPDRFTRTFSDASPSNARWEAGFRYAILNANCYSYLVVSSLLQICFGMTKAPRDGEKSNTDLSSGSFLSFVVFLSSRLFYAAVLPISLQLFVPNSAMHGHSIANHAYILLLCKMPTPPYFPF